MKRSRAGCLTALVLVAGCGFSVSPGRSAPVPSGMVRAVADNAGLSLGVDQDWTINYGTMWQSHVLVFDAHAAFTTPTRLPTPTPGSPGYGYTLDSHGSLSCVLLSNMDQLPTRADLRVPTTGQSISGAVESVGQVTTPVGQGRVFVLHPIRAGVDPGVQVLYTDYLFVHVRKGFVGIVASSPSAGSLEALMKATIPTLRDVG